MSRYQVETQEIVYTSYEIKADSEEKARQLIQDGEVPLPWPLTQISEDLTIINAWESES